MFMVKARNGVGLGCLLVVYGLVLRAIGQPVRPVVIGLIWLGFFSLAILPSM